MTKPHTASQDSSFEELYRGYVVKYFPFQHEDGSFSASMSVHKGNEFVTGHKLTNLDQTHTTLESASLAGRQLALEWVDSHHEVNTEDSQ